MDNRLFSGVFEKDDLGLLVTFANQAAIAIENARLFTQTDQALARRVEELSLFQRIDQQLNRSLDLNQVLSLSLNWAIALTNAAGGSIGLFEELDSEDAEAAKLGTRQVLRLMVFRGEEDHSESRLVPLGHPIVRQIMQEKRSVLSRDVTAEESVDGTPANVQLAVPIVQEGEITGLITLETQQNVEINREDTAFVERLATGGGGHQKCQAVRSDPCRQQGQERLHFPGGSRTARADDLDQGVYRSDERRVGRAAERPAEAVS